MRLGGEIAIANDVDQALDVFIIYFRCRHCRLHDTRTRYTYQNDIGRLCAAPLGVFLQRMHLSGSNSCWPCPRPHSRGEIGPGFLFGGHMLDSLRNRQTGCRCFGYERPAASPGSGGCCLLLFLNRSSQSHRTPPIRRPTAYISDSAFTRRAQREGYLMCHSKARSGPGCCCRRRAERVRSFAESARPDCRAVPFPLDRDCHHRAQCAARCNR